MSALQLTGELSVTKSDPAVMNQGLVGAAVAIAQSSSARPVFDLASLITPTAFIKVTMDINSLITHVSGDGDAGEDDAWSLAESGGNIVRTNASDYSGAESFTLELPTGSSDLVAGSITATHDGGSQTFAVTSSLSQNNQGVLSATTTISGADLTGTVDENRATAQLAYWPINDGINNYTTEGPAAPDGSTGVDTLTATLTAAKLNTNYQTQLNTITNQYNGENLISAWQITINQVAQSTTSDLSNFARQLGRIDNNVFVTGGDHTVANSSIVAETTFDYSVSVTDANGDSQTLVSSTPVRGMLTQV